MCKNFTGEQPRRSVTRLRHGCCPVNLLHIFFHICFISSTLFPKNTSGQLLLDFHGMMLTATKMIFQKLKPRVINFRDYKHFDNKNYRKELLTGISNSSLKFDYSSFSEFFNYVE